MTSTGEGAARRAPGLLEVLALVPDPRCRRGRRHSLVFVLAVAAVCVLAGARSFREAGDQAADLPQEVLARLGGRPHPLRRKAPRLARNGSAPCCRPWTLEEALTAIAVDGKWLRGVADGQVKLFAAMLDEERAIIGQVRVPDDTTEVTQVREPSTSPAARTTGAARRTTS